MSPASADLLVGQTVQFTTNISTNASKITWSVNGTAGGDSTVGTIDGTGKYTAPTAQLSTPATVTATETSDPVLTASAMVTVVGTGQVASTANPQVALYTIAPPVAANVSIQFGTDTTYGLTTWTQQARREFGVAGDAGGWNERPDPIPHASHVADAGRNAARGYGSHVHDGWIAGEAGPADHCDDSERADAAIRSGDAGLAGRSANAAGDRR